MLKRPFRALLCVGACTPRAEPYPEATLNCPVGALLESAKGAGQYSPGFHPGNRNADELKPCKGESEMSIFRTVLRVRDLWSPDKTAGTEFPGLAVLLDKL